MSKIDEIRSEMVAAMKAGDKERKAALSFLLSSLKNKAIGKRADLTEEEEGQVILKEIKQLKETLEMTPADRTDLIEEAQKRLSVLEEYAPKMMDADEIKEMCIRDRYIPDPSSVHSSVQLLPYADADMPQTHADTIFFLPVSTALRCV